MTTTKQHIFQSLRNGAVPNIGLEHFAVGIESTRAELHRIMELCQQGSGEIKFLRGGYGCGKTFAARMALLDAQHRGFATSFVVVSDNDMHFHRFDDVYSRIMQQLSTPTCPRAAFGDILDQWIGKIEDKLVNMGEDDTADDFDQKVQNRLNSELSALTGGKAPEDFIRVLQTIFALKQAGEYMDAGSLLSWLNGSKNISAQVKGRANIRGDITSKDALSYLRGVLEIVKAVGYKGMLIVIDEAETILRMRSDIRHKSLNGLRQIVDCANDYPGLMWLFTGTKEFFDNRKGVAGLEPLHQRLEFKKQGRFVNLRQPQLELTPFDQQRLENVAIRLRSIYPSSVHARIQSKVTDEFISMLVKQVTAGFHGDVGVIPRQFLREFVGVMDLVDQHDNFDPMEEYDFTPSNSLNLQEQAVLDQSKLIEEDSEDDLIPVEDSW